LIGIPGGRACPVATTSTRSSSSAPVPS
jgi:hypothetical protein